MKKVTVKIKTIILTMLTGSLIFSACQKNETETADNIAAPSTAAVTPERYVQKMFDEVDVEEDVVYGEAVNYKGEQETLLLDVYQPSGDSETNRPVIIWIHGGGLTGGSKTDEGVVKNLVLDFAKKGYVCLSIDYRVREEITDYHAALDDAVADAASAIKWIGENSEKYGVNKEKIAVGGYSAGGAVSINLCYDEVGKYGIEKDNLLGVIDLAGHKLYGGKVQEGAPACLIVQGSNDPRSSLEGSKQLAKLLEAANVDHIYYQIEGGGHDLSYKYNEISDRATMLLYKALTGNEVVVNTVGEISYEYEKIEKRITENPTYNVKQMELTVDGRLDEWKDAEVIELDIVKDAGTSLPEQEDFSGRVMVGWNEKDPCRIYISAVITDDVLQYNASQTKWYMNDCLEIALDISKNNQTAPITKCVIGASGKSLADLANEVNTEYQVIKEGNTYTFEMAIDVTKVDGIYEFDKDFSIRSDDIIGLSVSYNDCENNIREHQIGWMSGAANDRGTFRNIRFIAESVK